MLFCAVHFFFLLLLETQVSMSLAGNLTRFNRLERGCNDIGQELPCYKFIKDVTFYGSLL